MKTPLASLASFVAHLLVLSLVCSAAPSSARAEETFDCIQTGWSAGTPARPGAPRKVYLDEAGGDWTLSEGSNEIDSPVVRDDGRGTIRVSYQGMIETDLTPTSFKYLFDDSRCDEEQIGFATLTYEHILATEKDGMPEIERLVTNYTCECGVD